MLDRNSVIRKHSKSLDNGITSNNKNQSQNGTDNKVDIELAEELLSSKSLCPPLPGQHWAQSPLVQWSQLGGEGIVEREW